MQVLDFLRSNGLTILFGAIGVATSIVAIHYARKTYALQRASPDSDRQRSITVFWSREDMLSALLAQHDRANSGEVIWGQTVSMRSYSQKLLDQVVRASARGVELNLIVNTNSPSLDEFLMIFKQFRSVKVAGATDNTVRVQGLGDREVIVGFPTLTTYSAIRFTDPAFVKLVRGWFSDRWTAVYKDNPLS